MKIWGVSTETSLGVSNERGSSMKGGLQWKGVSNEKGLQWKGPSNSTQMMIISSQTREKCNFTLKKGLNFFNSQFLVHMSLILRTQNWKWSVFRYRNKHRFVNFALVKRIHFYKLGIFLFNWRVTWNHTDSPFKSL